MAQSQAKPQTADPDRVPETLCDGPFNVSFGGGRALLTCTHPRAKAGPLVDRGQVEIELIVRARIAFSMDNLVALRDLLNRLVPRDPPAEGAAASGGANIH